MGNQIGPLGEGEHATVIIRLTGKLKAEDAEDFKRELDRLLEQYRPKMQELTRPIKKGSPRRKKGPTAKKKTRRK